MEKGFWENVFDTMVLARHGMEETYKDAVNGVYNPQFTSDSAERRYADSAIREMVCALQNCGIINSYNPIAIHELINDMTEC